MAYYNDTREARKLITDQEISYLNYLNKKQKDLNNGFIPQIMDTRTKYEKNKDKDYINKQLRKLAYNLFDNDVKYSETFIKYFELKNINYSKFTVVYDDLVKQFKGTDAQPFLVLQTAEKLISNIIQTGTTGGFNNNMIVENLQQVKEEMNNYKFNNTFEEKETVEKLDAVIYLYQYLFNDETTITINNTFTNKQYKNIRDELKDTINEIIDLLVRNDIEEGEKQYQIFKLLSDIKRESLIKMTSFINNGEISLNKNDISY